MNAPKKSIIMKQDGEYLTAMAERVTGNRVYTPIFSVYKYDAAEVPTKHAAKAVIRKLQVEHHQNGKWQIIEFWRHNGEERPVMAL